MVGSMMSLGFGFVTTAAGGVNWRGATLGSFPLLAGRGDRSPPPPPPPIFFGFGGCGMNGEMSGANIVTAFFTFICTCSLVASENASVTMETWMTKEERKDRFWCP